MVNGSWTNINIKKIPTKRPIVSKVAQKKVDNITQNIIISHQDWSDWKFQTHWNNSELVVTKS